MSESDPGTESLSELNLGIRELFRVVIPGAYVVLLLEWLGSEKIRGWLGDSHSLARIAISVVAGLIAYGLQVHEKWWPYSYVFDKHRMRLNDAVVGIVNGDGTKNYVSEYKYFLEIYAPKMKDRIHYFSSFYYMLDEMSLISVVAAVALLCSFFSNLNSNSRVSSRFVIVALAVQILRLYVVVNDRQKADSSESSRPWYVLPLEWSWVAILGIWLVWNFVLSVFLHHVWPRGDVYDIDWRFWILLAAACVFERLAEKQWKSVISEQVAMVREKSSDLRKVLGAEPSPKS